MNAKWINARAARFCRLAIFLAIIAIALASVSPALSRTSESQGFLQAQSSPPLTCYNREEWERTAYRNGYVLIWHGWVTPSLTEHRMFIYVHPDGYWVLMRQPPDGDPTFICPFAFGDDGHVLDSWTPPPKGDNPPTPSGGTGPLRGT